VAPGIAAFPESMSTATQDKLVEHVPLQRPGTPQDVAEAVLYLCSANYVTGTVLVVDGGRLVKPASS